MEWEYKTFSYTRFFFYLSEMNNHLLYLDPRTVLINVSFYAGDDEEQKQLVNEYAPLCDWMKDMLGEKISKVEVSKRLSTSPCALISGKYGWSANIIKA